MRPPPQRPAAARAPPRALKLIATLATPVLAARFWSAASRWTRATPTRGDLFAMMRSTLAELAVAAFAAVVVACALLRARAAADEEDAIARSRRARIEARIEEMSRAASASDGGGGGATTTTTRSTTAVHNACDDPTCFRCVPSAFASRTRANAASIAEDATMAATLSSDVRAHVRDAASGADGGSAPPPLGTGQAPTVFAIANLPTTPIHERDGRGCSAMGRCWCAQLWDKKTGGDLALLEEYASVITDEVDALESKQASVARFVLGLDGGGGDRDGGGGGGRINKSRRHARSGSFIPFSPGENGNVYNRDGEWTRYDLYKNGAETVGAAVDFPNTMRVLRRLRRVLLSNWSPYDRVRAVNAVPRGLSLPAHLSAQGPSVSILPTHLDAFQLHHLTPFNSTPTSLRMMERPSDTPRTESAKKKRTRPRRSLRTTATARAGAASRAAPPCAREGSTSGARTSLGSRPGRRSRRITVRRTRARGATWGFACRRAAPPPAAPAASPRRAS
jgi:hypothetical protein